MRWQMQCNQKEQNQRTCDYVGLETGNAKNNSEYIANQENQTTRTTGLRNIQKHTTETQDENY